MKTLHFHTLRIIIKSEHFRRATEHRLIISEYGLVSVAVYKFIFVCEKLCTLPPQLCYMFYLHGSAKLVKHCLVYLLLMHELQLHCRTQLNSHFSARSWIHKEFTCYRTFYTLDHTKSVSLVGNRHRMYNS